MPAFDLYSDSVCTGLAYPIPRYGEWSPVSCASCVCRHYGCRRAAHRPVVGAFDSAAAAAGVAAVCRPRMVIANFLEPWLYGANTGISSFGAAGGGLSFGPLCGGPPVSSYPRLSPFAS